MADAADSKSAGGDFVRVQVPPPALWLRILRSLFYANFIDYFHKKW